MGVFTQSAPRGFRGKLFEINWAFVLLILLVGLIGVGMLYSVEGGAWNPYASRHALRLGVGLIAMVVIALFPPRFWMGIAYPAFLGALVLLIGVELIGTTAMGAQRWIDIGPIRMQPSEIMKIALVLALARYYHDLPEEKVSSLGGLIIPALMIAVPMGLIIKQPDLGTSLLLAATGVVIVFLAGLSWKVIIGSGVLGGIAGGFFFQYGLQDYQRRRIMTFLNPEEDPMGAGYHILQSKIALGSGGMTGKGYMEGTQAHLNFLPEKQTDFIFTMLGEEFGFIGGLVVLSLYALILANCIMIATSCRSVFLRLVVMGVATTFSLYVFINVGMVMGMLPVVGVPLPMISYGGTVMMTVLIGLGLILGAHVHRDTEPPKGAGLFG
ncbi:MAG: rod shape-determining protein RodA [Oceanicaulis sp.]|jgi:rod shape determining protein RodA|uniref:rod shape-determining protein RodA n=1 Tax=unclassified Oceanicaulis TaxID=2632123 RepID=UPI000066D5B1|nr:MULTISPECIES: rod shape-determining protein RodA [unclassified Oceanicaulis]EAP91542.1 rod shape-determining protein RodA [Oceanicaulis sp. HTCC2633]MAB68540.1 rod shape-determining protein RodA [Oceanicaulis sp.]MBC39806.1 rod shape-determining protein RodA [Oceanicaulis sp.]MBG36115.1 rod shape-determining protein RodA [Oceanicaulis sp.]HBU61343.1 rod shape-determining protein RodA [Oceanicaulis sp.]